MTQKNSSHSPQQKALLLQKKIFKSLKSESELLLGETPSTILKYEKENRLDFKSVKNLRPISKGDLIQEVRSHDVTFIADFHTFDQAQRTALRIVREAYRPGENWMIGLELIPSQFQRALDDFQDEKISLTDFHKIISYQQEWGFPWENYAPLFQWAKENQVRLIALNRPKNFVKSTEERELLERDQWTAGIITDIFFDQIRNKKRPKIVVLYGELHVGTKHLPFQLSKISKSFLKKPLSWITIHQNDDQLFWKLATQQKFPDSEILKLRKNVFCVFSSTPWTKLQSLITWAESATIDSSSDESDYLSTLKTFGTTVSDFLGIPPLSYEEINIYTVNEPHLIESIADKKIFNRKELSLIRHHIINNHSLYIPKLNIAYLGSPSFNRIAELAAICILKINKPQKSLFEPTIQDFFRLVHEFAFGFFGSLVLNPRRKCDLFQDHLIRLQSLEKGSKPSFPYELESRKIVLDFFRTSNLEQKLPETRVGPAFFIGSKYLGRILGKALYDSVLKDQFSISDLHRIFFKQDPTSAVIELFEVGSQIKLDPSKSVHL